MRSLRAESFVFDSPAREGPSGSGLKMTAKRYTTSTSLAETDGLTLLTAHCIGSHKEQWEPTIERVFQLQRSKDKFHKIREVWAFDWQNHGDAAVLNQDALGSRPQGVSVFEWASAITAFVRSARMRGHRIVPMGHSAGAGAVMLTVKDFLASCLPYVALILVEPTIVTKEVFDAQFDARTASIKFVVAATSVRRDTWSNKDEAFTWLSKRFPWNLWDSRVVRSLVDYGLQDAPDPPPRVILKCDRNQEAISYPDIYPHFEAAVEMGRVCHSLPIHVVWGSRAEIVPAHIQDSLSNDFPRLAASVARIEDTGHMVVQEKPDELAQAICNILDTIDINAPVRSKL